MRLEISPDQRFTCAQCGLCCRTATVVVTPDEVERYRRAGVGRWHTDAHASLDPAAAAAGVGDAFEAAPHGHFTIRRRADGACGFLSDDNRCRIHEELGGEAKPLACRVFPFRFHVVDGRAMVTASASCPTIVRNDGAPLTGQARDIGALRAEWARAFPEKGGTLLFASGRPIDGATLAAIKTTLRRMLDPGAAEPDLATGVERMARWLEDLSRHRVARLERAAFAEYVALTGRHAAESAAAAPPAEPSAVTRLLARGFLFTAVSVREQASVTRSLGRHLRRMRQLAHLHGLAPATAGVDRSALRRVRLDLDDQDVRRILRHALRAAVDDLGTGRRPVIDELAVAAARVTAGIAMAAMAVHREGRDRIDARALTDGIAAAATLGHADTGALATVLPALAGGVDALRLLNRWLRRDQRGTTDV